jgi:hypothetical protein
MTPFQRWPSQYWERSGAEGSGCQPLIGGLSGITSSMAHGLARDFEELPDKDDD